MGSDLISGCAIIDKSPSYCKSWTCQSIFQNVQVGVSEQYFYQPPGEVIHIIHTVYGWLHIRTSR